jgi:hypothetical protein
VRIAFIGDSTTRTGYPEIAGRLLNAELGPGSVEVMNLGVSASDVHTTTYLFERYYSSIRPDIVVYYQGRNDVVFEHMRGLAVLADALGEDPEAIFSRPNPRRGLLDILLGSEDWTERLSKQERAWRDNFSVRTGAGPPVGSASHLLGAGLSARSVYPGRPHGGRR